MRSSSDSVFRRLRRYRVHAFLLVYTPLLLVADSVLGSLGRQFAGALTFGVLGACTRFVEPARRWEVWLCVPIATLFEVYGSLIWGGYTYRLHNIPLYVPPGHALVFVFGITAAALPLVQRHGTRFRHGVLAIATAWAVAGVTVFPLVTHRWDVQGAILSCPCSPGASFAPAGARCSRRSGSPWPRSRSRAPQSATGAGRR